MESQGFRNKVDFPAIFVGIRFQERARPGKVRPMRARPCNQKYMCSILRLAGMGLDIDEFEALQLAVEGGAVDVEYLGGFFDVAAGAFERLGDGFALDLFERQMRWDETFGLRGRGGLQVFGQTLNR